MNVLEILFENYIANNIDSDEARKVFELCLKAETKEESDMIFDIIGAGFDTERKNSFYAGFRTAFRIFLGLCLP